MEQFYEITPQSKRFAECMTYWNESDKQSSDEENVPQACSAY